MNANRRTATVFALIAVAMLAFAFASVPLYHLFLDRTGLYGTVQRAGRAPGGTGKTIVASLDTNIGRGLALHATPEGAARQIEVGAAETGIVRATNDGARPVAVTATLNVTPMRVGKYVKRIACFCDTARTLAPGETARLAIRYFVDPALLTDPDTDDVQEITLSFTFYPVDSRRKPS